MCRKLPPKRSKSFHTPNTQRAHVLISCFFLRRRRDAMSADKRSLSATRKNKLRYTIRGGFDFDTMVSAYAVTCVTSNTCLHATPIHQSPQLESQVHLGSGLRITFSIGKKCVKNFLKRLLKCPFLCFFYTGSVHVLISR